MKIKEHYPLEKNKTKIPNVYCQCVSLIIQKLGEKIKTNVKFYDSVVSVLDR